MSQRYDVAHIREQGVEFVLVRVHASFGAKTNQERSELQAAFQRAAGDAGLAGAVVPVWDAGGGRVGSWAPHLWLTYFSGIDLEFVATHVTTSLTC